MTPAVCNQGLCTRKAAKDSEFCRAHARLKSRAYPEGTRVVFRPSPVSLALYSMHPARGETGTVVKVPLGGGRRSTFLKGPAGGLLYVAWDGEPPGRAPMRATPGNGWVCGVSPFDCARE
jgi:hypothetical protein